ncbi:Uncharacterised protein [Bordetella pertussis]|nr:Uncharacterised protein [Bordetella pertussis]
MAASVAGRSRCGPSWPKPVTEMYTRPGLRWRACS